MKSRESSQVGCDLESTLVEGRLLAPPVMLREHDKYTIVTF